MRPAVEARLAEPAVPPERTIGEMLGGFETAVLVASGRHHRMETRATRITAVEPNGRIWLLSPRAIRLDDDGANAAEIVLVCQDDLGWSLALRGHARGVHDRDRPLDSAVTLIAVEPESAECWNQEGACVARMGHRSRAETKTDAVASPSLLPSSCAERHRQELECLRAELTSPVRILRRSG